MRDLWKFLAGGAVALALFVSGALYAQPESTWSVATLAPELTTHFDRDGIMQSGGWTEVNTDNATAASTAQLNAWSRYFFQCDVDSRIAAGTAASGQAADGDDGYIAAGAIVRLPTTDTLRYYSFLNITADGECRYVEAK